jgi:hypothetical protein
MKKTILLFSIFALIASSCGQTTEKQADNDILFIELSKNHGLLFLKYDKEMKLWYEPHIVDFRNDDTLKIKNLENGFEAFLSVSPNGKYVVIDNIIKGYVYVTETDSILHENYLCAIIDIENAKIIHSMQTDCGGEWDKNNNWINGDKIIFSAEGETTDNWQKHQDSLRSEILKRKENKLVKESFLQEMYIRDIVRVSNDSVLVHIPFNLHGFDCGAPDCYSTDVSFGFKLGDSLKFPETLPFKEHEFGCVPETRLSGVFQLQEQTAEHVIYHSTKHKRTLVLFSNYKIWGTTAYYFVGLEQDKITGKKVYEILDKAINELNEFYKIYTSTFLETPEYEHFLE